MARNPQALAKALIRASAPNGGDPAAGGFGSVPSVQTGGGTSPLVASYGDWMTGRNLGRGGLPRDAATFVAGSFGPLAPMQPQPVDAPDPDTGRTDPRRWQYPVSWNMPHGMPGDEGLKLASFGNLRVIGDTYSVARACIQLRKDELLGLGWDVVPTKSAEKAMRADKAKRKEFDERRAKIVKFFRRPDQQYFAFRDWFGVLLEDVLVVDALSLYLWPARSKGKGVLGSSLSQLAALDGSTIRPLLDVHGATPLPPNPGYQQYLYGVPRTDLVTMRAGDDVAGMVDAASREYPADQLIYRPQNPRDWTPYGFAPIERALVPILSGIQRQQFQLDFFSEGTIPGLFVSAGDPNATPTQLRELQDALNAMAGDPAWKHKIIVLPQGSKTDPQRPAELAGAFDEIIMTQVCMSFSVMPMELGISPKTSTTQSSGAANQMAKSSQSTQERKGNVPLLEWFADIFNHIIQVVCRQQDMQWWWEGLEKDEDEQTKTTIQKDKVSIGLMSIDEARIENGQQPWGLPTTSDPVLITASGAIPFGSIDPNTGLPVGNTTPPAPAGPPQGGPGGPGGQPAVPPGSPKPIGPGGATKPVPAGSKPATATATPTAAVTPAHAGAQNSAAATQKPASVSSPNTAPKPGDKKPPAKKVDTFAALRELDLMRRRITKGRSIADWTPEHVPADVFNTLLEDGTGAGVDRARTVVKAIAGRQARDQAVAAPTMHVVNGLRHLAAGLAHGTVSTASFVDDAVDVLALGIRAALGLGADHALADLGHLSQVVKAASPDPDWVQSYDSRFFQYGQQVQVGYEAGRGLTTVASGDGKWVARWDTTSTDPCDLCEARNGTEYAIGTIPGYPGMGGFGKLATICRGGPHCRCQITYIHTADAAPTGATQQPSTGPTGTPGAAQNATVEALTAAEQQQQLARVNTARQALAAAYPTLVEGAGSVAANPDAYTEFLNQLAADMAEEQRQYLLGLLQDLLASGATAVGRDDPVVTSASRQAGGDENGQDGLGGLLAGTTIAAATAAALAAQVHSQQEAAPATAADQAQAQPTTKGAGPVCECCAGTGEHETGYECYRCDAGGRLDPDEVGTPFCDDTVRIAKGGDVAGKVYDYLAKNYPADVLGWVRDAQWHGPMTVKLSDVDMGRRRGGARNPKKVQAIAQAVKDGQKLDPVVLVRTPDGLPYRVADGYHRTLGLAHAGRSTVLAWVGNVDSDEGPWDKAMHAAKLNKVGPHGYSHGWIREGIPDIHPDLPTETPPEHHDSGPWYKYSQTWDEVEHDYGDALDDRDFTDDGASVSAHADGSVLIVFPAEEKDHWTPFTALDPAEARMLADDLERALDIDPEHPAYTEDTIDPDTGLIDWYTTEFGGIAGVHASGDIRIGMPNGKPGSLDEFDVGHDDAWRLVDGLRDMADHLDDLPEEDAE